MRITTAVLCTSLVLAFSNAAKADDTSDHPLLAHYPGFEIRDQAIIEYDEADVILGPIVEVDRERSIALQRIEGAIHNTQYRMKGKSVSVLQLYRNYETALRKLDAELLFSCLRDECFDMPRDGVGVFINNYLNNEGRYLMGVRKRVKGETAMLTARIVDGDNVTYVSLVLSADDANEERVIHQSIVESAAFDIQKIAIRSANELDRLIASSGKAVLDGIYFDHDKATIRPESRETLAAIADYVRSRATERFFVVGHTDGSGSYEYNLELSEERAAAVVEALLAVGVDEDRLRAVGIGPLAPADSNRDEAGMANNRRVELVEDLDQ